MKAKSDPKKATFSHNERTRPAIMFTIHEVFSFGDCPSISTFVTVAVVATPLKGVTKVSVMPAAANYY